MSNASSSLAHSRASRLMMDVWEHAFMVDYTVTERGKYIDAFLQNVN